MTPNDPPIPLTTPRADARGSYASLPPAAADESLADAPDPEADRPTLPIVRSQVPRGLLAIAGLVGVAGYAIATWGTAALWMPFLALGSAYLLGVFALLLMAGMPTRPRWFPSVAELGPLGAVGMVLAGLITWAIAQSWSSAAALMAVVGLAGVLGVGLVMSAKWMADRR